MSEVPPIVMSRPDWDRLDALLESAAARNLPGAEALRAEIDRASVVEPGEVPADIVTMNTTARFVDDAGANYTLTLVYPEGAGKPGTVSIMAPVGSALLGLKVGQSINWLLPGGKNTRLRVLEVLDQPEARQR
ncbi:MAG: nucleoside diphosphate kinase regulator [Proteobacteria bacterium]|nr:nucleoside diphosphate kinase regulator [Pseudomonadota bacterium]MBS0217261.1 nucleoside diphosphate kinase regulator [Pseudomonadota bacterium]